MRWIFADETTGEQVTLPWAGPNVNDDCQDINVTASSQIEKIRIGREDDTGITGLFMRLQGVEDVIKLGLEAASF